MAFWVDIRQAGQHILEVALGAQQGHEGTGGSKAAQDIKCPALCCPLLLGGKVFELGVAEIFCGGGFGLAWHGHQMPEHMILA